MSYAAYGLDNVKKSVDEGAKGLSWCPWCDRNVSEGFSLCFSNFCICKDCVDNADDETKRWKNDDGHGCFKCCKGKVKKQFDKLFFSKAESLTICNECIAWAREVFNNKNKFLQMNNDKQQCASFDEQLPAPEMVADTAAPVQSPSLPHSYAGYLLVYGGKSENAGMDQLNIFPDDGREHTELDAVKVLYFESADPSGLDKPFQTALEWIDGLKRCRQCGCTEHNCKQCIEKTGQPCHWVEADLCSACAPVKKVTVENAYPTNFFTQLCSIGHVDVTLRIKQKNDELTMQIITDGNTALKPFVVIGTAAELDNEFFTAIMPDVKEVRGLVTNASDVKEDAAAKKQDAPKPAADKKPAGGSSKKKTPAKKPAPAKKSAPVKKKVEKKPVEKKQPVAKPKAEKKAPVKKAAPVKAPVVPSVVEGMLFELPPVEKPVAEVVS